jgi:hypothetical protein
MSKLLASIIAAGLSCTAGCAPEPQPAALDPSARGAPTSAAPEFRYQVDGARGRVWWLTREGVFLHRVDAPGRASVPLEGWTWAGAPYACPPDLAIGPRGEVVVTSNVMPILWRIDPESLAVTSHAPALAAESHREIGFSRLRYSAAHEAFFAVSDIRGTLWRIDRQLARAQKIAPDRRSSHVRELPCTDFSLADEPAFPDRPLTPEA